MRMVLHGWCEDPLVGIWGRGKRGGQGSGPLLPLLLENSNFLNEMQSTWIPHPANKIISMTPSCGKIFLDPHDPKIP